jgi:hypothetical protein
MYYVVRSDRLRLGEGARRRWRLARADRFPESERWAANFAAWQATEYPKGRAGASEDRFAALAGIDAASVPAQADPIALCLPPRRKSEREPHLVELAPFTDAKLPAGPPALALGALL